MIFAGCLLRPQRPGETPCWIWCTFILSSQRACPEPDGGEPRKIRGNQAVDRMAAVSVLGRWSGNGPRWLEAASRCGRGSVTQGLYVYHSSRIFQHGDRLTNSMSWRLEADGF